jgi:hypothetical protein
MPARVVVARDRFRVDIAADGSRSLRALARLERGEVLAAFRAAEVVPAPTRHSIQVDARRHVLMEPDALRFTNHSCDPTVHIDTARRRIVALRRIEPGDEITYFYPATEWLMAEPFTCRCGSERCIGRIAGAAELPTAILARYPLGEHIEQLLRQQRPDAIALFPRMPFPSVSAP